LQRSAVGEAQRESHVAIGRYRHIQKRRKSWFPHWVGATPRGSYERWSVRDMIDSVIYLVDLPDRRSTISKKSGCDDGRIITRKAAQASCSDASRPNSFEAAGFLCAKNAGTANKKANIPTSQKSSKPNYIIQIISKKDSDYLKVVPFQKHNKKESHEISKVGWRAIGQLLDPTNKSIDPSAVGIDTFMRARSSRARRSSS